MTNLFSASRFLAAIPKILPYMGVTFHIVIVAVVLGSLLGLLVAVLRIKRIPVIQQILSVYISFMRGTPMLVQLMIVYFGLPLFIKGLTGIDINLWTKVIFVDITFVINEGAFLGEIFRGAIQAVPYEQTEAGYSVGLGRVQTFVQVVLPQSVKIALPAYGVDIIGIFHNTSIAFLIGVIDIVGRAKSIGIATGHALEAYIFVAIIYIAVSILLRVLFYKINETYSFDLKGGK